MKYLLIFCMMSSFFAGEIMIFDFSSNCNINSWFITNDNVMGGVSSSKMHLNSKGHGEFSGIVSTENNGGFAMTRTRTDISLHKNATKILLRVKGDEKQYQLRIKSSSRQAYWYVYQFKTTDTWQIIELPLKDFYPSYRGYQLDIGNFSDNKIKELAILIGNKIDEKFKLEIDWIKVD